VEGIAITGCRPRPDVLAAIERERELEADRLLERARRHVEERAREVRCWVCGYQCVNDAGTRCLYCCSSQAGTGAPRRVEHRADQVDVRGGAYYGMRVEHSKHIGRVMAVRW